MQLSNCNRDNAHQIVWNDLKLSTFHTHRWYAVKLIIWWTQFYISGIYFQVPSWWSWHMNHARRCVAKLLNDVKSTIQNSMQFRFRSICVTLRGNFFLFPFHLGILLVILNFNWSAFKFNCSRYRIRISNRFISYAKAGRIYFCT